MTMKPILVLACLLSVTVAFQIQSPPSFATGRVSLRRQELTTTELSLRLRRPKIPFFGGRSQQNEATTAVIDSPPDSTVSQVAVLERPSTEDEKMQVTAVEPTTSTKGEEDQSETQKLMEQVKDAGVAGVISYALWEMAFWTVSVPVCIVGYRELTGHWPDFSNQEDLQKLGAEAFAFVNFARFAVPLRIGLALSTTPWIEENVVERFMKDKKDETEGTTFGATNDYLNGLSNGDTNGSTNGSSTK